jgi:hypothetical protein
MNGDSEALSRIWEVINSNWSSIHVNDVEGGASCHLLASNEEIVWKQNGLGMYLPISDRARLADPVEFSYVPYFDRI